MLTAIRRILSKRSAAIELDKFRDDLWAAKKAQLAKQGIKEPYLTPLSRGEIVMTKASRDHAPIQNKAIRVTINNDGTTKTERFIDNSPRMEYDYCAFYIGNDRYGRFGGWGWLAVADLTEYDDDYRNAVNDLDAGDFDASQAADIIHKGIKKGDLLIAKSHNPIEAMRLLCEKLDNKDG